MWHSKTLRSVKNFQYILSLISIAAVIYGCSGMHAENRVENAAFEYRDIYLPVFDKHEFKDLSLNNLDDDWGIWGHNLGNVLPAKPSITVFATIDGNQEEEQFCFSSKKLYQYICNYIDDNYGRNDSMRFAIVPNDNELACLCEECLALGNSEGNATPAVYDMVTKLATKYPNHTFFTSHYLTTSQVPGKQLPPNTGVLVSAMEYPLSARSTPKEENFKNMLASWQGKTDKVYVWDYINNFDDYFTPFPVFSVMQQRLRTYRDAGVDGIFLNGSGTDYSTFSRLKKAVLAEMLINPDVDWKSLLRQRSKEFYPLAGDDIADFIIAQEDMVTANGKQLPLYEGVAVARKTYLPKEKFIEFYNKINDYKKVATGSEKTELETMAEALSLTVLELKRLDGKIDNDEHLVRRLRRLPGKKIEVYNEGCWTIAQYLEDYDFLKRNADETDGLNLLKGVKLQPKVALDEDYSDIRIVTDGLLGIPSNYHSGNLISSADPSLDISIPKTEGLSKIRVWMVYHPAFHIGLPAEVQLKAGGQTLARKTPPRPKGHIGHSYVDFDNVPSGTPVEISLVKNPEVRTMAIDEIEGFK